MEGAYIDERAMSKLRWRCRRGLLENDLFVERFFASRERVTESQARGLLRLMDLSDNDLLDLLLRRVEPERATFIAEGDDVADVSNAESIAVLNLMRAPITTHAAAFLPIELSNP